MCGWDAAAAAVTSDGSSKTEGAESVLCRHYLGAKGEWVRGCIVCGGEGGAAAAAATAAVSAAAAAAVVPCRVLSQCFAGTIWAPNVSGWDGCLQGRHGVAFAAESEAPHRLAHR